MMKLSVRQLRQCIGFTILLGLSEIAWSSDCEALKVVPAGSYAVGSKEFNNPTSSALGLIERVTASGKDIVVVIERTNQGGLISLFPTLKGSFSPLCGILNIPIGKSIYQIGSFSSIVNVELRGSPGASANFTVYTSGQPNSDTNKPATPQRVRIPVEVFVFSSASLTEIDAHLSAASEIWAQAGVILVFKVRRFDPEKTKENLGTEMTIKTYLGCSQRFDEPGFKQRESLTKLKSTPLAMGIFIAPNTTQSQAEAEFMQVYIANDPFGSPKGRTVAHEIGHLLLGEGHPGGTRGVVPCTPERANDPAPAKENTPTTSGLMGAADATSSTKIDTRDAEVARRKAITLPGATWWN